MKIKTIEELDKAINSFLDKYDGKDILITNEELDYIKKELESYVGIAIKNKVIEDTYKVNMEVDEIAGTLSIYIGDKNEESEDNIQDSKECKQTTCTCGESLKRNIS